MKIWTIFLLSSVDARCLLVTFGTENDFPLNTFTVICMKQWTIFIEFCGYHMSAGNIWYYFTFTGAINLCGEWYLAGNEIRIFF